jgi:hypothetical protein
MDAKRKAASSITDGAVKKLKQGSLTSFFGAPTASKNLHTGANARFDKQSWINGLNPEHKELLK